MKKTILNILMGLGILTLNMATSCSKEKDVTPQLKETSDGFQAKDLNQLATQWDDGWISRIKEAYTEVSKGNIRVWIFHPDKQADAYHADLHVSDDNAANILVLPHFSNIAALQDHGIQSFESITFLSANATEKATGKPVHLVFFKKHYNAGHGRYMLVVTESKAEFEKEFGNNYINSSSWDYMEQIKSWTKLANMQWRNKFALSSNLLHGIWSSGNSSTLSYYYVNGGYAGATGVSVADRFKFVSNNTYESEHTGASGMVGNMQFSHIEYKGNYSIKNNWKIQLTNRFQGSTEEFDGYFEAIKNGLLLVIIDRNNTVNTLAKH